MKLSELKAKIGEYQYLEDTDIIDVALASVISTRLSLGDPIWLILIGASSGGKSQILRPLSLTDPKFLHRIDDLTENTFLSGANVGKGKDASLLNKIGSRGIIVVSDLTVLFSKAKESRAAILSQFRMIYDGEMTKFSGNSDKPITWKGALGVLSGSTPSIYSHFEEVADMGERFIYYRMKEYNAEKATRLSMGRKLYGKSLDDTLALMYDEYIKHVVTSEREKTVEIPHFLQEAIIDISSLAEKIRTTSHMDYRGEVMTKLPVSAMPMRVALQLSAIAKGLSIMRQAEGGELTSKDQAIIEWCAYSLGNEEKRACLRVLAGIPEETYVSTQTIADKVGLATTVISSILQNLAAVGVILRSGGESGLSWRIASMKDYATIRRIEGIEEKVAIAERRTTHEDGSSHGLSADEDLKAFANEAFDVINKK